MKAMIITLVGTLSISVACAQKIKEAEVPAAVKESFSKEFPGAKAKEWEKEKNGNFEAEFDLNKTESSATFTADGKLLETEREIAVSALPKAATTYLSKNYKDKKIKEAAKITEANGTVKYEAEVGGKDILFDANGNVFK